MSQEAAPDVEQEYMPIANIDDCHKQLTLQIKEVTEERDTLKAITQNQLKNLNELQEKCEECFISISQLPENKNSASDRYEEVMTDVTKLQTKQCEINELLNLALAEFDESMELINNSKDLFNSELNIANQRILVYQSNLTEIKVLAKKSIDTLEESIKAKRNLLEKVKKHFSSISRKSQDLQVELRQLTQSKENAIFINCDLQKTNEELEDKLKKSNDEEKSLKSSLTAKHEQLKEELEISKTELEDSNVYMEQLKAEIESVTENVEQQKYENQCLKNKLEEAKMLSNNLKNSLESKNDELTSYQMELEKHKVKVADLKNIIMQVEELKTKCSLKEVSIEELTEKQNEGNNLCSSLKDGLRTLNERIDDESSKYNNVLAETEEINVSITTINANIELRQRELSEMKKQYEEKINILSADIQKLMIDNSELVERIKEKEEIINDQQSSFENLKTELELNKNMLKEKSEINSFRDAELIKKLDDLKIKNEILQTELKSKKDALNTKKKHNETVRLTLEKITAEKEKYDNLIKSYEKEKEELKSSYNDQLNQTIQELQTLKVEETKKWETVRDSASKAEFTYYRVKSQAQRLKAEHSSINESLKTYNCENETLKMLIGWMKADISNSEAESTQSKLPSVGHEVPNYSPKSDSSFDDATESEQAEDIVTQQYQMPRVRLSQDTPRKKEAPYYSICEEPILITADKQEGSQNVRSQRDNRSSFQKRQENSSKLEDSSLEGPGPYETYEQDKKNIESRPAKHKLQDVIVVDDSSSDNVKMKRPKTPQKKVLTKKINPKTKKKINVTPKKKTILDLVIDSSN